MANAGIAEYQFLSDGMYKSYQLKHPTEPRAIVSEADFDKIIKVNVNGTLYSYRAAAKAMIAGDTAKNGRIIGACSQAGKRGKRTVSSCGQDG